MTKRLDEIFPIDPPVRKWSDEKAPDRDYSSVPFGEQTRWVPAARCRECGVVTWKTSLSGGRKRTRRQHRAGCSEPPGKFDRGEASQ